MPDYCINQIEFVLIEFAVCSRNCQFAKEYFEQFANRSSQLLSNFTEL